MGCRSCRIDGMTCAKDDGWISKVVMVDRLDQPRHYHWEELIQGTGFKMSDGDPSQEVLANR